MLLAFLLLCADAAPQPLPKEQAADGWVKLFDGATTFGWTVDGEAKVVIGELVIGGVKPTKATVNPQLDNFEYRVEAAWSGKEAGRIGIYRSGEEKSKIFAWIGFGKGDEFISKSGHVIAKPSFARTLMADVPADSRLTIRKLDVRPLAATLPSLGQRPLELLCNAKDLTGWKLFPGDKYKSKYTVTPEGWINVKDGPGDLRTEKQFQDFIFQGDIRTNGTHLNSGIFFRCLPDQYQQGYECQIRNQFDKDPYKPVDFGTGAIYRRVAARAIVAKDREWFTLTILARGNRFTSWVDGWMTADWVDDRKPAENARNGYRAGAGHISLQGHDPTTDVDFRNLRIAELAGSR